MVNTKDLKLGMIGCGVHAKANILSTLRMLDQPMQCVCARHLDRAQAAAEKFDIPKVYDNYKNMIQNETLDAVFVATDAKSQAEIVTDCLNAHLDVFVEKPLGMNEKEAIKIAELSASTGKKVMVGFMKRFSPSYRLMKKVMNNEKDFGKKLSFMGMFAITSGRPGWDDEFYIKVGGIHYVDLMRYLFGEVIEINGFTNSVDVQVDNIFTMRFDSGMIGSMFFGGLPAWKRHWEEICITGTNGFVKVDNMMSVKYHYDKPVDTKGPRWTNIDEEDVIVTPVNTSSSGGWRDLYLNGYVGEIEHFLECIVNNKTPITDAVDNVKTMALCDKIFKSLKS